ncbi:MULTISPECIES: uroporphyrinogen-III synthase [unclassified Rhodococcus (in: high G+C Gram-positive bacteria)]|uniref:uroporphyrinogen-III synthase n=1 Tax=unclassified Rhodococcus (in: high G+C Gram-positive bacteria) TaxID=192944 RepID=UPI0021C22796|nr:MULTISPECIES: uroporphyrinogen-III synthase [unclassified Rhodococcus (in: high G+C Gram-positive bacteria)]
MAPLSGKTIALTAERRADEFAALLERRGARTVHVPAIHVLPLLDDSDLREKTADFIERPPELTVISTGIGFRGWLDAAEGWDNREELLAALGSTRIIARGPKARGAIRGAGLREIWSPTTEASQEVADHLAAEGVAGMDVAVQLHGTITEWEPTIHLSEALGRLGADVRAIPVYRWIRPVDQQPLIDLLAEILNHDVDAVTFTSAPAVASMLSTAKDNGLLDEFLTALRGPVVAICVGPVTSAPLDALDVPTRMPERARLGALAKYVVEQLGAGPQPAE